MKIFTVCAGLLMITGILNAQSVLRYEFANSLEEKNGAGPTLSVLGTPGNYVTDTLNEINQLTKTVYRFEQNSGFQFDNTAASNFIGDSYTIELYFVFDYLQSWKRVVDWKNRKSDAGAYVYYGQLNFYPIVYSGDAPVLPGEYTYYVVTRDGPTGQVLMYTDDGVQIDFIDNGGQALLDSDNMLNFFHDDLMVPNEASSGAVAILNLYNYVLDSTTIKENFENIGGTVFSVDQKEQEPLEISIYPNPASGVATIDLSCFKSESTVDLIIHDLLGRTIYSALFQPGRSGVAIIDVSSFPQGIYMVRAESATRQVTKKLIVR